MDWPVKPCEKNTVLWTKLKEDGRSQRSFPNILKNT